jgi:hypothetical protein
MTMAIQLQEALNAHDLEAFLALFHEDYRSEQPVHPGRGVGGRDQVRANWSAIFQGVPDFTANLLGHCQAGGQVWSEWRWTGTRATGGTLDMAGVLILGIRDAHIAWGRLYIEPVETSDESIQVAVHKMTGGPSEED